MCIPGYVPKLNHRNRNGGGVALYIRNTIGCNRDKTFLVTLVAPSLNGYVLKLKNQEPNRSWLQHGIDLLAQL